MPEGPGSRKTGDQHTGRQQKTVGSHDPRSPDAPRDVPSPQPHAQSVAFAADQILEDAACTLVSESMQSAASASRPAGVRFLTRTERDHESASDCGLESTSRGQQITRGGANARKFLGFDRPCAAQPRKKRRFAVTTNLR
jgi:hypothetical protein